MTPKLSDLFELDREISQIRKLLREKEEDREVTLAGILSAEISKQRGYELSRIVETKRVPKAADFSRAFPAELFIQVVDINLKRADDLIGKDRVTSLCEMKPMISYRVIETGEHE